MELKKLSLDDIDKISPYFKNIHHRACDCTLGGVFIWRDYFESYYAIIDDTLVFAFGKDKKSYTYPIGKNIDAAFLAIEDEVGKSSSPLTFYICSQEDMLKVKKRYPDAVVQEIRDGFDYLYDYDSLATFKGKKYSGQRNHVNKFKRLYENYSFEELNSENAAECLEFLEKFLSCRERTAATDEEAAKIKEIFENLGKYSSYGFFGGVLRVDGNVIGFSVAEDVADTMFVHIEKADISYDGVYQMLVCSFASHFKRTGVLYINREDDAGNEGLRKSKLAYQPIELLPKYSITVN